MPGESKFQTIVMNALKRKYVFEEEIWFFKNSAGAYSRSGTPDVVGSLFGFFFAVELKDKGKKGSTLQKRKVAHIIRTGGMAMISDDLEAILNYLEEECEKRFKKFNIIR